MKILIAGAGNMGKTYARSFIASRFIAAKDLYILTRHRASAEVLPEIISDNIHEEAGEFIRLADIIIIAVKPQDFLKLAAGIKAFISSDQLILSVMAGIKLETITELLGSKKVVRSMPNLPTQVGMGMTVFTASNELDRKELFIIQNLINTTGKSIYVENEKSIDAATAISGSGPAYVYFFMEAMVQAAVKMGFSIAQAELLVNQTFMGAVHLHNQNNITCNEWIEKVSSKGGTTEAAFRILQKGEVKEDIDQALMAAFTRAQELGS
jgi:pyrroline-5-carboxylate reductase